MPKSSRSINRKIRKTFRKRQSEIESTVMKEIKEKIIKPRPQYMPKWLYTYLKKLIINI